MATFGTPGGHADFEHAVPPKTMRARQEAERIRAVAEISAWFEKLPNGLDSLAKYEMILPAEEKSAHSSERHKQRALKLSTVRSTRLESEHAFVRGLVGCGFLTGVVAATALSAPIAGSWSYYAVAAPGALLFKTAVGVVKSARTWLANSRRRERRLQKLVDKSGDIKKAKSRAVSAAEKALSPFEASVFEHLKVHDPDFVKAIRSGVARRDYTDALVNNTQAIVTRYRLEHEFPLIKMVRSFNPDSADLLTMQAVEMEAADEIGRRLAEKLDTTWPPLTGVGPSDNASWQRSRLAEMGNVYRKRANQIYAQEHHAIDFKMKELALAV